MQAHKTVADGVRELKKAKDEEDATRNHMNQSHSGVAVEPLFERLHFAGVLRQHSNCRRQAVIREGLRDVNEGNDASGAERGGEQGENDHPDCEGHRA